MKWLLPICSDKFPKPTKLVCVADTALTDTPFQSISINSLDSLDDLSKKAGISLEPERFRGNIWIRTGKPWTEFDWVGKLIKIDKVELKVDSRIIWKWKKLDNIYETAPQSFELDVFIESTEPLERVKNLITAAKKGLSLIHI